MKDSEVTGNDSTESLIESLHAVRRKKSLIINPDYLDDEKLPEEERTAVLKEIFNRNIRKKQLSRIISHLTPVLDGDHPPSALIFGPTGSGKTVTLRNGVKSSLLLTLSNHRLQVFKTFLQFFVRIQLAFDPFNDAAYRTVALHFKVTTDLLQAFPPCLWSDHEKIINDTLCKSQRQT